MDKQSITIFDAHCDTASELLNQHQRLADNNLHFSLSRAEEYGGYVQVFAAWIDTEQYPDGFARACQIFENLRHELAMHPTRINLATDAASVQTTLEQGRIAAMLSVEDGAALSGDLDNLYRLYDLGVRFLTLTWNGTNALADGIGVSDGGGLTDFGRAVVREMGRIGMAVDVSHLSERAFWEVMEFAEGPVCATHSNARAICSHPRNLTDEQFRALAERGGIAGMNLYDIFVRDGGGADVSDVFRHIAHFLSLGGGDAIGIGADFDGIDRTAFQLQNVSMLDNLVKEMEKNGLLSEQIEKITHKNFLHFIKSFDKK